MQEQLKQRLEELKKEYAIGQARLRQLEEEQNRVGETMLRISGAIQVLEEALGEEARPDEAAKLSATAAEKASGTAS